MISSGEHISLSDQKRRKRLRQKGPNGPQRHFRVPVIPLATGQGRLTSARSTCGIIQHLVTELLQLLGDGHLAGRDVRRTRCHVRQIAMYVSHVTLRMSMVDIGAAFGRDRTTVSYACHVVEDRRDDLHFDRFIAGVERMVQSVFLTEGDGDHA